MIYLDHHATTPMDPRVGACLMAGLSAPSNPASLSHAAGRSARARLARAEADVLARLGAADGRLIWTSGATEANNLFLLGAISDPIGVHVLSGATEHPSVHGPMRALAAQHALVESLPVASDGRLDLEALTRLISPQTRMVSVMLANNEVGTIQPIAEMVQIVRSQAPRALVHCDATQGLAHLSIDINALGIDALTLSGHKVYGPPGIGALWIRSDLELQPRLFGGGHQGGLRPGTPPVALAEALACAITLASEDRAEEAPRVLALRERLRVGLQAAVGGVQINGSLTHRLPGNLHVWFEGVEAAALMDALPEIALSAGSACHGDHQRPSSTLLAMGLSERAFQSVRFGLGRWTTAAEIDLVIARIAEAVPRLRALASAQPIL